MLFKKQPAKEFGWDWHAWQFFVMLLPPGVALLIGEVLLWDQRRMEARKAEQQKKMKEENPDNQPRLSIRPPRVGEASGKAGKDSPPPTDIAGAQPLGDTEAAHLARLEERIVTLEAALTDKQTPMAVSSSSSTRSTPGDPSSTPPGAANDDRTKGRPRSRWWPFTRRDAAASHVNAVDSTASAAADTSELHSASDTPRVQGPACPPPSPSAPDGDRLAPSNAAPETAVAQLRRGIWAMIPGARPSEVARGRWAGRTTGGGSE